MGTFYITLVPRGIIHTTLFPQGTIQTTDHNWLFCLMRRKLGFLCSLCRCCLLVLISSFFHYFSLSFFLSFSLSLHRSYFSKEAYTPLSLSQCFLLIIFPLPKIQFTSQVSLIKLTFLKTTLFSRDMYLQR